MKPISADEIVVELLKNCTLLKSVHIVGVEWGIIDLVICIVPNGVYEVTWVPAMYECRAEIEGMFEETYNIVVVPIDPNSAQLAFVQLSAKTKHTFPLNTLGSRK
jgi:hypothetical protein